MSLRMKKIKTAPDSGVYRGNRYAKTSAYNVRRHAEMTAKEFRDGGWQAHVIQGNDGRFYVYRRDPEAPKAEAGLFSGHKQRGRKRK